jgi:LPXTG-motif cell wall-anchored protein
MFRVVLILVLALSFPHQAADGNPYASNIARAEAYLVSRFNPNLGLLYESDDPGTHWLTGEYPGFHWRYNQTYWLYSDNFFASLALQADHREISKLINASINRYRQPPSGVFEVVAGERIHLPLHSAEDYIVAEGANYVITIRRHNSTALALNWLDLWLYEALEYDLEGNYRSARFLLRRAETMWTGNGFWDLSYLFTHTYSNHKLAIFLFTARALGITVPEEDNMLQHLWDMQDQYGGIASLTDAAGRPTGSSNTETTALTLLIYNQSLLAKFPKTELSNVGQTSTLLALMMAIALVLSAMFLRRKRKNPQ